MPVQACKQPIPRFQNRSLDRRVAAAVIGLVSVTGNLGGFVAPVAFGFIEKITARLDMDKPKEDVHQKRCHMDR